MIQKLNKLNYLKQDTKAQQNFLLVFFILLLFTLMFLVPFPILSLFFIILIIFNDKLDTGSLVGCGFFTAISSFYCNWLLEDIYKVI